MSKPTTEQILAALVKINTTIESISFQAKCIEGELDMEDAETDDQGKKLCMEMMWDNNDLDNWTSMEANLTDVRDLLLRL